MNRIEFIKKGFMAMLGVTTLANAETLEKEFYNEDEINKLHETQEEQIIGKSCSGDALVTTNYANTDEIRIESSNFVVNGNTILKGNVFIEVSPGKYRKL